MTVSEALRGRMKSRFGSVEEQLDANRRLVQALSNNDFVLLLGAGIPAAVGYPTWEGLIEGVRERLGRNVQLPTLAPLQQAQDLWSYYLERVFKARPVTDAVQRAEAEIEFGASVIDVLRSLKRDLEQPEWFHELRQILPDDIVTTNLDRTIEDQVLDGLVNVYRFKDGKKPLSYRGVRNLYKIHGDVDDPRSVVFTEEQYLRWQQDDNYVSAKLKVFFSERPTLCLGYSFRDPDVQLSHFEAFRRFFGSVEPVFILLDPTLQAESEWGVLQETRVYYRSTNVVLLFGELEEFLHVATGKARAYKESTRFLIDQMAPVRESLQEWLLRMGSNRGIAQFGSLRNAVPRTFTKF